MSSVNQRETFYQRIPPAWPHPKRSTWISPITYFSTNNENSWWEWRGWAQMWFDWFIKCAGVICRYGGTWLLKLTNLIVISQWFSNTKERYYLQIFGREEIVTTFWKVVTASTDTQSEMVESFSLLNCQTHTHTHAPPTPVILWKVEADSDLRHGNGTCVKCHLTSKITVVTSHHIRWYAQRQVKWLNYSSIYSFPISLQFDMTVDITNGNSPLWHNEPFLLCEWMRYTSYVTPLHWTVNN